MNAYHKVSNTQTTKCDRFHCFEIDARTCPSPFPFFPHSRNKYSNDCNDLTLPRHQPARYTLPDINKRISTFPYNNKENAIRVATPLPSGAAKLFDSRNTNRTNFWLRGRGYGAQGVLGSALNHLEEGPGGFGDGKKALPILNFHGVATTKKVLHKQTVRPTALA